MLQPHLARAVGVTSSGYNGINGQGIQNDPYQIATCENLQDIDVHPDKVFILSNDIDCSDSVNWNGGTGFTPIGMSQSFMGSLDGRGHTINNLYIDQTDNAEDNAYVGLFAQTADSARFLNFNLTNATIIGAQTAVGKSGATGGIVGKISDTNGYPKISRVSFDGAITVPSCNGVQHMGGIVGAQYGFLEIQFSSSTGSITVNGGADCGDYNYAAGGLTGLLEANRDANVYDSYSAMNITFNGEATEYCAVGCRNIGGLVGYGNNIGLRKTYAAGQLKVQGDAGSFLQYVNVGGLVGEHSSNISLPDSFASTPITVPGGVQYVGGLVGNDHGYGVSGGSWGPWPGRQCAMRW